MKKSIIALGLVAVSALSGCATVPDSKTKVGNWEIGTEGVMGGGLYYAKTHVTKTHFEDTGDFSSLTIGCMDGAIEGREAQIKLFTNSELQKYYTGAGIKSGEQVRGWVSIDGAKRIPITYSGGKYGVEMYVWPVNKSLVKALKTAKEVEFELFYRKYVFDISELGGHMNKFDQHCKL